MRKTFNFLRQNLWLLAAVGAGTGAGIGGTAVAQTSPPAGGPPPVVATPAEPDAIALYPETSGKLANTENWTQLWGQRMVRNVNRPVLLPVRPAAGKANGQVVLVVPGGGYTFVSIDNEGYAVANRLAAAGYTAFILKYRVKATAPDTDQFGKDLTESIRQELSTPRDQRPPLAVHAPAVEDAQQAMRLVAKLAGEWKLNAERIAYIGFSAGARTGGALVAAAVPGTQPHTVGLIYGPMQAINPKGALPPLFTALAADDPLISPSEFGLVQTWLKAGARVELHFYERGSHGFGLRPQGTTSDAWMDSYLNWLSKQ
jgi:acetyl esterase/lipase